MTAAITTHVLDLDAGRPAQGIAVSLWQVGADQPLAVGTTDSDGRIKQWSSSFALAAGHYRLQFDVAAWFASQQRESFYPQVDITFVVAAEAQHYHVPLLLNAHGYSTYRGS